MSYIVPVTYRDQNFRDYDALSFFSLDTIEDISIIRKRKASVTIRTSKMIDNVRLNAQYLKRETNLSEAIQDRKYITSITNEYRGERQTFHKCYFKCQASFHRKPKHLIFNECIFKNGIGNLSGILSLTITDSNIGRIKNWNEILSNCDDLQYVYLSDYGEIKNGKLCICNIMTDILAETSDDYAFRIIPRYTIRFGAFGFTIPDEMKVIEGTTSVNVKFRMYDSVNNEITSGLQLTINSTILTYDNGYWCATLTFNPIHDNMNLLVNVEGAMNRSQFSQALAGGTTSFNDVNFVGSLEGFVLPANITSITFTSCTFHNAANAFDSQTSLESITMNNCVINGNSVDCIFNNCSGLTSLTISNLVTTNVLKATSIFRGCNKLQSLDLSNLTLSNATDMSNMFRECESLSTLTIGNLDTSNVTKMKNMFYGCKSLSSLSMSSFNTSNVTDMSNMFRECESLSTLTIGNLDTSNVTKMKNMFYGCKSLSSLSMSSFNTSNVTDMSNMFRECESLQGINISQWNTANVINMNSMFCGCENMETIFIDGISTVSVTNMKNMFRGCESLTEIDIESFNTSNVEDMSGMFAYCINMESLLIGNGFNTSSVENMENMFRGCDSITTLDLSSYDTVDVTNMNSMFRGCSNLGTLNISSFNTTNVTDMRDIFRNCSNISRLTLGANCDATESNTTVYLKKSESTYNTTLSLTRESDYVYVK